MPASRTTARGDATRARMVGVMADLVQRRGYAATGLADVTQASGAPKGSLYHHFPGGKEELGVAAVEAAAAQVEQAIAALLERSSVARAVERLAELQAQALEASGFERGCPVATLVLETAASSEPLADAAAAGFASWHACLAEALRRSGFAPAAARDRSTLALSALEGALVLARAQRDGAPLRAVGRELAPLLSSPE